MAEYSYPGVYVEEIGAPREIAGVPTGTTAFVGFASTGPIDHPTIVASVADYEATFGTISAAQKLSLSVRDFFLNGGGKAVIVRADADGRHGRADALIGKAKVKTGLYALARMEERVGLLVVPDAAYLREKDAAQVTQTAASFAEAHGVFHIADIPGAVAGKGHDAAVRWSKTIARSRNMAIYHPWVGGPKNANTARPPSGVAAGIYARIDQAHGVWKAPAGQAAAAMGVTSLVQTVTPADAEMLRSAGINAIRKIAGAGIVLWGAGTFAAASDSEWKYVNIRRFLLFLERSIEEGLSWAVFEPNGETLWAEIRLEISAFLHTAWRGGALQGVTPKDAYFVRCDATTMTQDDIENGRIIASVGVAPLKPAEFVIIRIGIRCN